MDSLLEGDGFEPSVPVAKKSVFVAKGELRGWKGGSPQRGVFFTGYRWFESISLQGRVNEPRSLSDGLREGCWLTASAALRYWNTWIAERIGAADVCVTSDIPLASRCLKKGARVVSSTGKQWTEANIGNALAGRDIARHLRELGENTRGPGPLTKQDRSRFLGALDAAVQAGMREEVR
jgi:uncharacterized protein YaiI (UPF0178 family)